MRVKCTIGEIFLKNKDIKYTLTAYCNDEKTPIEDMKYEFRIKTLHESMFGKLKIALNTSSMYITYKYGYFEVLFNVFKEGTDNIIEADIYRADFFDEPDSFEFTSRETLGTVRIAYDAVAEKFDLCTHSRLEPNIIDRFFMNAFLIDKRIKVSAIIANVFDSTKGTAKSKFNLFKGLVALRNYHKRFEMKYSKENIDEVISELKNDSFHELNIHSGSDADSTYQKIYLPSSPSDNGLNLSNIKLFDTKFYEKYKNILYFAVSPYANGVQNFMVKRRCIVRNVKEPKKGILEITNINASDVIRIVIEEPDEKNSFVVFKQEDTLIIAFRGTKTANDLTTDIKYEYSEFYEGYAHDGIKVLATEFFDSWWSRMENKMRKFNLNKVILTGHSLGGSLAIIVGVILMKEKKIDSKNLEVVAYSAAPVLSENLIEITKDNFISFVYSNDVCSFLSYGSFCDFKYLCASLGSQIDLFQRNKNIELLTNQVRTYLLESNLYPKLYLTSKVVQLKTMAKSSSQSFSEFTQLFKNVSQNDRDDKITITKMHDHKFSTEIVFDLSAVLYHFPKSMVAAFQRSIQQLTGEVEDISSSEGIT